MKFVLVLVFGYVICVGLAGCTAYRPLVIEGVEGDRSSLNGMSGSSPRRGELLSRQSRITLNDGRLYEGLIVEALPNEILLSRDAAISGLAHVHRDTVSIQMSEIRSLTVKVTSVKRTIGLGVLGVVTAFAWSSARDATRTWTGD